MKTLLAILTALAALIITPLVDKSTLKESGFKPGQGR